MSASATTKTPSASGTVANLSFQLPDLVALTSPFPFRINNKCKLATEKSEGWLLGSGPMKLEGPVVMEGEKHVLNSVKYGLLASLCSPVADTPQLKILADFWSLVFISHARILQGSMGHGWRLSTIHAESVEDGLELLAANELLKSLAPLLRHILSSRAPSQQFQWTRRFARSVKAFARAQLLLDSSMKTGHAPTLSEYIALGRDTYASSMFVDLLELLEISSRPSGCPSKEVERVEEITMWTMYCVRWILDIISFASGPGLATLSPLLTHSPTHNLISLLETHKNLSVQGAMNYAGGMVKEALEEIQHLERELLPNSLGAGPGEGQGWSEWLGSNIGLVKSAVGMGDTQSPRTKSKFLADVPVDFTCRLYEYEESEVELSPEQIPVETARYVRAMKDWIVGTVHWGYESEPYFGQKGDEVRSFGWVFLSGGDGEGQGARER